MPQPLSILVVTNIYPSATHPTQGIFVEEQVKGLRAVGLPVEVFYVDRTGKGMGAYFRMLRPLSAAIAETQPALLHVMYGGVMADRVTRWNSHRPTIVTFHGSDLLGENFSGPWRKWLSGYGVRCSRRAAGEAQGVVVVSRRLQQALPAGLDESRVRVIPCGIDLDRFKPIDQLACQRQLGWDHRSFHILFASNNQDPVKRPELAAEAVKRLSSDDVPSELHTLRNVANSEVPIWLNAADALLLTSAQEGSPTVVKEALACGLPVVSVDVGDVAERIEGIAGCHLALPEAVDLAAKLRLVRRTRGRVNAREQILELSVGNIATKLEKFYRDTLSRWGQTENLAGCDTRDPNSAATRDLPVTLNNLRIG